MYTKISERTGVGRALCSMGRRAVLPLVSECGIRDVRIGLVQSLLGISQDRGRAVLGLVKWCGAKGRADCGKKRSALHRPPQCAASVCAARCICHRTAVHIPVQCRTSGMGIAVKMKWGVLLEPQGRSFSPVQPCSGIQDSLLMIKAKHSSCPHVTHPQMWRCTVGNPGIGIPDESEAKWWGLMRE